MLVKGTHTVKQRIEVEIDDCELKHILRSCSNVLLLSILQERAENEFLNALAGRPGDFCVRKREGHKSWLWEIDADWDYHKNESIDEPIRELTDKELQMYNEVCHWATRQQIYLDPMWLIENSH